MTQTVNSQDAQVSATRPGLARFLVKSVEGGEVVLTVPGTRYEPRAAAPEGIAPGAIVSGIVTARGRKVWTIPAGGRFVSPLLGEPRVVQGRVLAVEGNTMVVQAGYPLAIELPEGKSAMDLKNGPVRPGAMVNVTVWPGAKFVVA